LITLFGRRAAAFVLGATVLLVACAGNGGPSAPAEPNVARAATTTTSPVSLALRLCNGKKPKRIGTIKDPAIVEASGVVQSRRHPGVLWVHNDSGDTARVFAITKKGVALRQYTLTGAGAVDWEDIAISAGSNGAPDTLYLGDIGDNNSVRNNINVYAIPEPDPAHDTSAAAPQVEPLLYPDGAHNAEAMFVDPASRDLFIVTKEFSGNSRVYRKQGGLLSGQPTLSLVANLSLGGGELVTAGDISPDGSAIVLRTYGAVFVWSRKPGEDIATAFTRPPCHAPSPAEQQGEAISIDPNGLGYVTTSEGVHAPIRHVNAG
jgi:hypothetical protein